MRSIQQRQDCEESGLADTVFQVADLGEFSARFFIDGDIEAVLAHQQHALRAKRELRMKPNVAKEIGNDRTLESVLK